jgi:hypothetical protein
LTDPRLFCLIIDLGANTVCSAQKDETFAILPERSCREADIFSAINSEFDSWMHLDSLPETTFRSIGDYVTNGSEL